MRVLWVPQWTVLPVIVEDREMVEENLQRGRLPVVGQQMDPLARNRLGDSEGSLPQRQFIISFSILILCLSISTALSYLHFNSECLLGLRTQRPWSYSPAAATWRPAVQRARATHLRLSDGPGTIPKRFQYVRSYRRIT